RPPEVSGCTDRIPLDRALRASVWVGGRRVRAVVGDVQGAGLLVVSDAERVSKAHTVDLGAGLRGTDGEEVAVRHRVGAVVLRVDPKHLAPQVVRVAGGALRVVVLPAR